MSQFAEAATPITVDPVSNVLKWILLAVAIVSFALFAWATVLTYERAPPQPDRLTTSAGATLMTSDSIVAGKAGFQKADLMDYGSLYGMGSYYGQDYTAWTLSCSPFQAAGTLILACPPSYSAWPPLGKAGGTIMKRRLIML